MVMGRCVGPTPRVGCAMPPHGAWGLHCLPGNESSPDQTSFHYFWLSTVDYLADKRILVQEETRRWQRNER